MTLHGKIIQRFPGDQKVVSDATFTTGPSEPYIDATSIAETYDNTKTYAVDSVVNYNGKIYKCTTAVTSAEGFDSSKWTEMGTLALMIGDINKVLDTL